MSKPIRQGDVYVVPVTTIPASAAPIPRDKGRVVLAYGEVTGHSHAIAAPSATLLSVSENERFLRIVGSAVDLVHEEHATIGTSKLYWQRVPHTAERSFADRCISCGADLAIVPETPHAAVAWAYSSWLHDLHAWSFDDMAYRAEAATAGSNFWRTRKYAAGPTAVAFGSTPAEALLALAAKLREEQG